MRATKKPAPAAPQRAATKPLDSRSVVIERQRDAERLAKLNAPVRTTSASRRSHLRAVLMWAPSSGTETQESRLLRALTTGAVTTVECRDDLDIPCPASRVLRLRRDGYQIDTRWVRQITGAARSVHRYAEYVLIRA